MTDFGFSVRDIVAVGMAEVGSTKWERETTSPSFNKSKLALIQGGISIRLDGQPVDAFSYGQVFESRLLRDPIPEITLSVLLSDTTDAPLDNRTSGDLQLIEIGMANPSGDKLLMQLWQARCTSINYDFPDEQFATVGYTYRGVDFRVTASTNNKVIASF